MDINNFNTTNKKFSKILEIEPNKPHNRCNDGAADFLGNFGLVQCKIILQLMEVI